MMRQAVKVLALITLAVGGPATEAAAAPIVYTNQATFTAALAGTTISTEDFSASPLGVIGGGTTDLGLFSVTIDQNPDLFTAIVDGGSINGTRQLNGDLDEGGVVFNLSNFSPSPIVAFGGTWTSTTTGDLLTITVNGTTFQFDNHLAFPGNGFLGIIDFAGFTTVSLGRESVTSFGEAFGLDDVQVAAAVPEPATLLLLGTGLLVAGARRRTRRAI